MKLKSRNEKTAYNAVVGLISQVIIILFNFISRTIFIHYLSTEYLGLNGLFTNILTILSFSELGIGEAMVYAMYKPLKENDNNKISALMNYYKKAYIVISLIVLTMGVFISFFINNIISEPPKINDNLQFLFLLYLLNTFISYLYSYKKSILFVDLKRYIVLYIQMLFTLIQLLFQFLVLYLYRNFVLFYIIQIICTFLINFTITIYVNHRYPWLKDNNNKLNKKERSNITNNVKALATTKIAGVIGSGTDNIIASKLLGLQIVGIVSNYSLIINAINGLLWSILYGITNSIGDFNVNSSIENRRRIFDQLYMFSFVVFTIIGCCIVALINPFIELWIGKNYVTSIIVPYSLVLSIFIGGMNFAAYSFRISLGYFNEVKYFYIAYPILNIILSILLANKYGIAGIFFATSISRLLTAEIGDGYFVFKYGLKRNPFLYFFGEFICIMFFSFITLLMYKFVSFMAYKGIVFFLIKCACCFVLTTLVVLLFVFRLKSFKELKNRLLSLIKKERKV